MTASSTHLERRRPAPAAELRRLARRYARNPNLSVLLPEGAGHTAARLAGDRHTDVWLVSWPEGTEGEWHDHGDRLGAFAVALGEVVEEVQALSGVGAVRRCTLGESDGRTFGSGHVHRLVAAGPGRALTVHAYSPGLAS